MDIRLAIEAASRAIAPENPQPGTLRTSTEPLTEVADWVEAHLERDSHILGCLGCALQEEHPNELEFAGMLNTYLRSFAEELRMLAKAPDAEPYAEMRVRVAATLARWSCIVTEVIEPATA
jgi:hypothetical protein